MGLMAWPGMSRPFWITASSCSMVRPRSTRHEGLLALAWFEVAVAFWRACMIGDRNDEWTVADEWPVLPPEGAPVIEPRASLRRCVVQPATAVVRRAMFLRVNDVTSRVHNTLRSRSSPLVAP